MVAKSYENLPQVGEPFEESGRMYVLIKTKSGSEKKVRWYTVSEYKKMYPDAVVAAAGPVWNARKGFGFGDLGYITIFKGEISMDDEYFSKSCARYCVRWGWYIVSEDEVPSDLPSYAEPKKLLWSKVGNADNSLKDDTSVNNAVNELIFDIARHEPVAEPGTRIEVEVTVVSASGFETRYGTSTNHIMKDPDGNTYQWVTTAKSWEVGYTTKLRGTIKEFKGNVNVLTRCSEIH